MCFLHIDLKLNNKNKNFIEINNIMPIDYKPLVSTLDNNVGFNLKISEFPDLETKERNNKNNNTKKVIVPVNITNKVITNNSKVITNNSKVITNNSKVITNKIKNSCLIKDRSLEYLSSKIVDLENINIRIKNKFTNVNTAIEDENKSLKLKIINLDKDLDNKNNLLLNITNIKEDYYYKNKDNLQYMSFLSSYNTLRNY